MEKKQVNLSAELVFCNADTPAINSLELLSAQLPALIEESGWKLVGDASNLNAPEWFQNRLRVMGDTDPMFASILLKEGYPRYLSASDNPINDESDSVHFWPIEVIRDIIPQLAAKQGIPGYFGHFEDMRVLPPTAAVYFSAVEVQNPQTQERGVILNSYIPNNPDVRGAIRLGMVNNSLVAVADFELGNVKDQLKMVALRANYLSVDFVRKGVEAIRGTGVLAYNGATNMELTQETIALLNSQNPEELIQKVPILKAKFDLLSSASKTGDLSSDNLVAANTALSTIATMLGCSVDKIGDSLKDVLSKAIVGFLSAEINAIVDEDVKLQVAKASEGLTFNSVEEVKAHVSVTKKVVENLLKNNPGLKVEAQTGILSGLQNLSSVGTGKKEANLLDKYLGADAPR